MVNLQILSILFDLKKNKSSKNKACFSTDINSNVLNSDKRRLLRYIFFFC